jgi:hypothetical protein
VTPAVRIRLAPSLAAFTAPAVRDPLTRRVAELHTALRIPVNEPPTIDLAAFDADDIETLGDTRLLIWIHGAPARLPHGLEMDTGEHAEDVANRIAAILFANREQFITSEVVARFHGRARDADPARVGALLRALVNRGFHIERASFEGADRWFERSTWSIEALRVRLVIAPGPTDAVRSGVRGRDAAPDRLVDILQRVRAGQQWGRGTLCPPIEVVEDPGLAESQFRIQINDLTFPPERGLARDELFFRGAASAAPAASRTVLHPLTGEAGFVVAGEPDLSMVGGVHDHLGFAVLHLDRALRREGAALVCGELVEAALDRVGLSAPKLVRWVRGRIGTPRLVAVLQLLLDEGVPVDRTEILESLLALDDVEEADLDRRIVFRAEPGATLVTSRPPAGGDDRELADAVRERIRRRLAMMHGSGGDTLRVILLDAGLDRRLAQRDPLDDHERERLIAVIGRAAGPRPDPSPGPVVLATAGARRALRELIALEFPGLAVMSYSELEPNLNITPVAQVAWAVPDPAPPARADVAAPLAMERAALASDLQPE